MIAKRVTSPITFAELHARLGGIPLERIRMKPPPGTATEEDLAKLHGPLCELIDGVFVEKAVGTLESLLGQYLARLIGNHAEENDLGLVLGGDGFIRIEPGLIRAPDVTFIPWEALPGDDLPEEVFWSVSPGLVVEVLSPGNTGPEIARKLREFFRFGCKRAWVIDPRTRTARVQTSATKCKELDAEGVLEGGRVLPGFKLPLKDLFSLGRRRKKKPR